MKLFPDFETKKRFMKTGLPIILGVAWSPIVWMVVIATLGQGLFTLTGSWPVTQLIVLVIVFFAMYMLLRAFMRIGSKFYGDGH